MLMLLLAVALQAEAPTEPVARSRPGPSGPSEIEVVGKRLKKLHVEFGLDGIGFYDCRVTVSSGDPLVDGFACPAAKVCASDRMPTYGGFLTCIDRRIVAAVMKHDRQSSPR